VKTRVADGFQVDRGRKIQRSPQTQPLEETDYYLANKMASAAGEEALETDDVVERLSQDSIVNALSEIPPQFRDVVVLVDIGDFSYADAAQILMSMEPCVNLPWRGAPKHLAEGHCEGEPCDRCESSSRRPLTDAEWREAETHLGDRDYCRAATARGDVAPSSARARRAHAAGVDGQARRASAGSTRPLREAWAILR
jgi:hypothetical protein